MNNVRIEKVSVQLDRERSLVCSLYAMAEIEAEYGDLKTAITKLGTAERAVICKFLWLFLLYEDTDLSETETAGLIHGVDEYYLLDRIFSAIRVSLPAAEIEEENRDQSPIGASDGAEWDWFFYIGTVLLGMSEREFWRCTLRKLLALWKIHESVHGLKKQDEAQVEEVFIDQLRW